MDSEYKKRLINCIYAIIKEDRTIGDDELNKKLTELGFSVDSSIAGAIRGVRAGFKDLELSNKLRNW